MAKLVNGVLVDEEANCRCNDSCGCDICMPDEKCEAMNLCRPTKSDTGEKKVVDDIIGALRDKICEKYNIRGDEFVGFDKEVGVEGFEYDEMVGLTRTQDSKKAILEKIFNDKNIGDGRFGLSDDGVSTKLLDKSYSPMIVRKYTRIGFPLYVSLICDYNLNDLDELVHNCIDFCEEQNVLDNTIQGARNFTGILSDYIDTYYNSKKRGCVESIAIIFYVDKMFVSSLKGDAMNHASCRQELYDSINIMTQI
jgi:hypothetical protein